MSFCKFVESLAVSLNESFEDINYGGCGVFAALMGEEIAKHTKHIRIALRGSDLKGCIDKAREKLSKKRNRTTLDWRANNISFGHVWLEFRWHGKWYSVDAWDGVVLSSDFPDNEDRQSGYMTLKEIKEVSESDQGWNDCFNRNNIPRMKDMIQIHFNEYRAEKQKSVKQVAQVA